MTAGTVVVTLAVCATLGMVVPWAVMRMLVPSLARGPLAENYRGDKVFLGLGVVWAVWAFCATIAGVVLAGSDSVLPVLTLAGPLALVCFSFGLIDDAFGTSADRGFRGHLSALFRGRLTTGGLKLLSISFASFIAGLIIAQISFGSGSSGLALLLAVPSGAAIALTSNLVNLTDLRPGRALKTYSLLGILGVLSTAFLLGDVVFEGGASSSGRAVLDAVSLLMFVYGPVLAVWRYDLTGQGMLGDAGANAMGAVAGLLIVVGLPFWAMIAYLVLVLVLNLASEKISFSRLIEGNRILRRFDAVGRSLDADALDLEDSRR